MCVCLLWLLVCLFVCLFVCFRSFLLRVLLFFLRLFEPLYRLIRRRRPSLADPAAAHSDELDVPDTVLMRAPSLSRFDSFFRESSRRARTPHAASLGRTARSGSLRTTEEGSAVASEGPSHAPLPARMQASVPPTLGECGATPSALAAGPVPPVATLPSPKTPSVAGRPVPRAPSGRYQ